MAGNLLKRRWAAVYVVAGIALTAWMVIKRKPAPPVAHAQKPAPAVASQPVPATIPAVAIKPQPPPPREEPVRIRGRVVGADDQPIAGADVTLPAPAADDDAPRRGPVAESRTDADGHFEIAFLKSSFSVAATYAATLQPQDWNGADLVAKAGGFGLAWKHLNTPDLKDDLVLKLPADDVPIDGRILTLEGQPVPGVTVSVTSVSPLNQQPIDAAFPADDDAAGAPALPRILPLSGNGNIDPAVSDEQGRFHIRGIGRERAVSLQLHGTMIGDARIDAVTQVMAPQARPPSRRFPGIAPLPGLVTYGANFEYVAIPGRSVRGTVRDAATGKPLPGVTVTTSRFAGPSQGFDPQGFFTCVADAQGRYQLDGLPKGAGNQLMAVPTPDQPYFARQVTVDDTPGLGPVNLDVDLHKGTWITGRITDKTTGKPVPARLTYTTYLENKLAFDLPEFRRNGGTGTINIQLPPPRTRPDGTYRLIAAPGKAIVGATAELSRYRRGFGFEKIEALQKPNTMLELYQPAPSPQATHAAVELDVPPGAETVTADLQFDPGETIHITVTNRDGKPAAVPLSVSGDTPEGYDQWRPRSIEGPAFVAFAFGPDDVRTIFVLDESAKLGRAARVWLADLPQRKRIMQLQPLSEITGRLLDANGALAAKTALEARESKSKQALPPVVTGDDGRFRYTLIPGCKYTITIAGRGPNSGAIAVRDFSPEAGKTKDLGDVRATTGMMMAQ